MNRYYSISDGFQTFSVWDRAHVPVPGSSEFECAADTTLVAKSLMKEPAAAALMGDLVRRIYGGPVREEHLAQQFADAVALGTLGLEFGEDGPRPRSLGRDQPSSGRPTVPTEPPVDRPPGTEKPALLRSWIEFRVIEEFGASVAGHFECDATDRVRSGRFDGASVRVDELPVGATARITFDGLLYDDSTTGNAFDGGQQILLDHPFGRGHRVEVTTGDSVTVVLRRPLLRRVETPTLRFANDSVLLVPLGPDGCPMPALATALSALDADEGTTLLLLGHTSAVGRTAHNSDVARRRMAGVDAMLRDDRQAWVSLAAEHGAPSDIQRHLDMLAQAHGWPCAPGRTDGIVDEQTHAAVTGFQHEYNRHHDHQLEIDGLTTRETLGALFDVQRQTLELQCRVLGVGPALVASPRYFGSSSQLVCRDELIEHPKLPESYTAEGQRRVDLVLVDRPLAWTPSIGAAALVDVARIRELVVDPRTVGPGDLVMQLVDHYGRPLGVEPYRLATQSDQREGATDDQGLVVERGLTGRSARLQLRDGAVTVFDHGYLEACRVRHDNIAPLVPYEDPDDPWLDEDDGGSFEGALSVGDHDEADDQAPAPGIVDDEDR